MDRQSLRKGDNPFMKCLQSLSVAALLAYTCATTSVHAAKRSTRSTPTASARYAQINREIGRYAIVKRDLSGYSVEGGTLHAYLLHGAPRKLVAHHYGESGQAAEEYYFWNNRLFFVLRAVFTYDQPLGHKPSGKMKRTGEHRFYFSNGKLVRWQEGRKLRPLSSQQAKDYEEYTLLIAREFLQKVRS
jgi:hypothetical protein